MSLDVLYPEVEQIKDRQLRDQVAAVWTSLARGSGWSDYRDMPAAPGARISHLSHSRFVLHTALAFAELAEGEMSISVDRDVLIAGAILMDASKAIEYIRADDGSMQQSEVGRLVPHAFLAASACHAAGLPAAVVHIVLSHTSQTTVEPQSVEAQLLHYLDKTAAAVVHGIGAARLADLPLAALTRG